jgi:hypothetical protein
VVLWIIRSGKRSWLVKSNMAILMGLAALPLGLGGHYGNQITMEKKKRSPGRRDAWENLKLRLMVR